MFPVTKESTKFERISVLPRTELGSETSMDRVVMTVSLVQLKVVQIQGNDGLMRWVVTESRRSFEMVIERHRKIVKRQFEKNLS